MFNIKINIFYIFGYNLKQLCLSWERVYEKRRKKFTNIVLEKLNWRFSVSNLDRITFFLALENTYILCEHAVLIHYLQIINCIPYYYFYSPFRTANSIFWNTKQKLICKPLIHCGARNVFYYQLIEDKLHLQYIFVKEE